MKPNTAAVYLSQFIIGVALWVAAFATYDAKSAFLVLLILIPLNALAALTGLVPVAGPFLYWKLSKALVFGSFFTWFPDVAPTWLTTLVFWLGFVQAVCLSLMMLLGWVGRTKVANATPSWSGAADSAQGNN